MSIAQGGRVIDGQREPNGYQQITSLAAAQSLTVPAGTSFILINVEAQNIRWRDDGTSPTASVGMLMMVGDWFEYSGVPPLLKFIEATAGAILNVSYYK